MISSESLSEGLKKVAEKGISQMTDIFNFHYSTSNTSEDGEEQADDISDVFFRIVQFRNDQLKLRGKFTSYDSYFSKSVNSA